MIKLKSLFFVITMKNQAGFTLIEVLISMLVLALGLLGLAAMQATTLKNNQSAYFRSQATQFAYDIADRMRANKLEASKYAASTYATTNIVALTAGVNNCKATTGCTPAQLATNDLYEWKGQVSGTLPNGTVLISTPGNNIFTITITWDDKTIFWDSNRTVGSTAFQMKFQL